jgi:hypothetical protein
VYAQINLHRSKERSYDFNASDASSNSPLITVVTSQSNIDNYGNVGLTSIGVSLTIFSTGEFIGLKVFFLNPTKA